MSDFVFNLKLSLDTNYLLKNNSQYIILKTAQPKLVVKVSKDLENFDANINNTKNIFKDKDIFATILEITKNFGFDILEQSSAEVFPEIGKPFNVILKDKKIYMPTAKDLIVAQWAINLNLIYLEKTELIDFMEVKTKLEKRLTKLGKKQFIENIWQGIHYALIMNKLQLVSGSNFKYITNFISNISEVLFDRKLVFTDKSKPQEFIFNTTYFMLKELVELRNSRDISFENYTNLIEKISNKFAKNNLDKLKIPLILNTVILGEASLHLDEISLHKDASKATSEYNNNCIKITEILNGIPETQDISGYLSAVGKNKYYNGDFVWALHLYTKEYTKEIISNENKKLLRGFANIFNDLGFWKTAKNFANEYLDFQEANGNDDIYKTYGRLGEIALRSGNYNEAIKYFENSINEQKNTFGDDNIEGRNICYLANAKLLNNELEEAENLYKETQILDNKENKINLYAELGLFAVALRKATDKQSIIEQILNILNNIENKKTVGDNLPKALIKFVLFKLDSEQYNNYATEIIDDLIKDNYYIDALACLPYIFNNVDNNIKYYLSEIEPEIIKWNKKVLETAKEIPNKIIFDENELNTQTCLNLINQVKETNDLNLLKKLNIFPVKLVAY